MDGRRLAIRTSQTAELIFKNVSVPAANLLGEEGKGFKIAMKTLDGGRIGVAAQALGVAEQVLAKTIAYVKERKQFDRPIAKFQNTQFKLAELAAKIEGARALTYAYDATLDKEEGRPYSVSAAMAKLIASDVVMETTTEAYSSLVVMGIAKTIQ